MNVRNQACVGIGGEELHVEIELGVELEKDGHRQRSLIVLQLIDIAGGEFECLRQVRTVTGFVPPAAVAAALPPYIFFIESPRCRSRSPYREAIRNIRNIAALSLHK